MKNLSLTRNSILPLEWKQRLMLPSILIIGLIIRCIHLGSRSLQYDDVFSIFLARRSLAEIVLGTAADTMPPLYYFLLHFWMLLGQNVWLIRGLSVLLSLGALWLLYQLIRHLFQAETALWAVFLAAISPFQFYHAQDVRNYPLLLCEQLTYLLFFVRIWTAHRQNKPTHWVNWLGFILAGTAALYTHNVSILALGIPNLFLLGDIIFKQAAQLKPKLAFFSRLLLAQALIVVFNLPWLVLLPAQFAKVQRAWSLSVPGIADAIQVPIIWIAGLPLPGIWLAAGALISLETLVFLGIQWIRAGRKDQRVVFLAVVTFILPVLFFALSFVMKPIFVARGFILSAMTFYGLAGWAIFSGWKNGIGKIILAGFIAAAAIGLPAQFTFQDFPRSPYQEAAAHLVAAQTSNKIVVHDNKLSYFPFHFYEPGLNEVFLADISGSGNDTFAPDSQKAMNIFPKANLQAAVGDYRVVDFVVFRVALDEYAAMGVKHPGIDWLERNFLLKEKTSFNDLEIYTYQRP